MSSQSKVCVYGKAQNRTALGIANAYIKVYPDATVTDLNNAFPSHLNSGRSNKDFPEIFAVKSQQAIDSGAFITDEPIATNDGKEVLIKALWTKDDFEKFAEHAKQYGIEVNECEETKKGVKGSYELKYLNNFVPPAPKAKSNKMIFAIAGGIILLILLIVLLFVDK